MLSRRAFFISALAATVLPVSVATATPTTVDWETHDVWLGFAGDARVNLKRAVYMRVYNASDERIIRAYQDYGLSPPWSAINESERRLLRWTKLSEWPRHPTVLVDKRGIVRIESCDPKRILQ